jgi:DNA mismatch endonuclease (patch repair protein)
MADIVSPAVRSRMMAGIRSRNTRPEIALRQGLHQLGFRFRLHSKRLSGTPDIVLPKYDAAIFVHGCFWHGHDCKYFKLPGTRTEFWRAKIGRNQENDVAARAALLRDGWRVLTVWECALRGRSDKQIVSLVARAAAWLKSPKRSLELRSPRRDGDSHGGRIW